MEKCQDQDVIRKMDELADKKTDQVTALREFRKQLAAYHRARGESGQRRSVSRPHVDVFRHSREE